jgi:microsomal dipeptidase-like Zn-dependent dipeptidase
MLLKPGETVELRPEGEGKDPVYRLRAPLLYDRVQLEAAVTRHGGKRHGAYELLAALRAEHGDVDISVLADHIDHAVEVAGIEHVGIASDFDGGGGVGGWEDASETAAVTEELLRRGYTPDEIEMMWSGNILRVMRAVEEAAATE